MIYPAITLWQPWATLVAADAKPLEFRRWPAPKNIRGKRIAVHAGAKPVSKTEIRDLLLRLHSSYWRETGLRREVAIKILEAALLAPGSLPRGAILCLATLGEPIRDEVLTAQLGLPAINDSDRGEHTSWGWPLTDITPLQPYVPAKGAQGFWNWTESAP